MRLRCSVWRSAISFCMRVALVYLKASISLARKHGIRMWPVRKYWSSGGGRGRASDIQRLWNKQLQVLNRCKSGCVLSKNTRRKHSRLISKWIGMILKSECPPQSAGKSATELARCFTYLTVQPSPLDLHTSFVANSSSLPALSKLRASKPQRILQPEDS